MKIFKSIFCFIFLFQLFQLSYAASAYAQAQKDVRFGAAVQAEHENALQELRIGSFRVTGCAWSKYQLSRNHMDSNEVAKLDQTINGLYDMGISPIVTVQCIPPGWARSVGDTFGNSTSRLPRDIADYNNFLSALVARYKDKVQYWQIENEINAPGFWGGTLDDYFYLLQNAKSVIKKVDAEKQILLSGLAGVSIEINMLAENGLTAEEKRKIIQFFQEGGVNAGDAEVIISRALEFIPGLLLRGPLYCDIIDLHNYVDSYADIPKVIQWVREKSGYLKPVWITEIGWPGPNRANVTIPPGEEPARAKELVKRILSALGSDNFQEQATDRIFWFSLADGGNWINAGLLKEGGAKKDAYYTYKTLVEKLGSAKFMERRRLSDNTQIYQFESTGAGGKYITVAWNDGGNGKLDSLPHRTNNITIYDYKGANVTSQYMQTQKVGADPIYVIEEVLVPPAAPSGFSAVSLSRSSIDLSWKDNSTNETGFRIYRSDDYRRYRQIATLPANSRSFKDTGLARSRIYCYRLVAYNSAGDSGRAQTLARTRGW